MLIDSVQPYNKPIIDLACSVCTVKYQTSVFCMDLPRSFVARSILKPRSDISQYRPQARSISLSLLQFNYHYSENIFELRVILDSFLYILTE